MLFGALAMFSLWMVINDGNEELRVSGLARNIVISLRAWAQDNGGKYPDSKHDEKATSNIAFRELYMSNLAQDEHLFSAPRSPFVPDGNLGDAPKFPKALEPGENHWMLVAGLSTKSPDRTPLIFENALDTSWPPKWHPGFFMHHVRGRSWRGKKIMVGFNDGSTIFVPLKRHGSHMTLNDETLRDLPPLKVLDIEERP
ncbi:hypothetical protein BGE01nite_40570 [Brevifollis gellanilyticus]|uniref:Uncharacterized protein n=2 Tax=Brevifollis gellanilyticus TaxID=748831 RepID=A0A512MDF8_9BACT|nr:hypothetical protein BGE01nite_40570 [Brevifollis gellanilyticus]